MVKIEEIERIEQREFGFMFAVGGEKIMKRKLKFHSQDELEYFIKTNNPLDCYVSVAFYTFPTAMEGWQGSVLFFDMQKLHTKCYLTILDWKRWICGSVVQKVIM